MYLGQIELWTLLIIFWIIYICLYIRERDRKKITDGVYTLNGLTYVVGDDSKYIMYKLSNFYVSEYVRSIKFEQISQDEGIITFGDVNFMTLGKGDKDFGVRYRISLVPKDDTTLMKLEYLGMRLSKVEPGQLLTQTYHKFFKEQLNILSCYYKNDKETV